MLTRVFITRDQSLADYLRSTTPPEHNLSVLVAADYIFNHFKNWLRKTPELGLDIETTHFDPYMGKILLTSFYAADKVFTFDNQTITPEEMCSSKDLENCTIIAHNLKFETLWFLKHNIHFKKTHCTMLTEQKLLQGADVEHNLPAVLHRRAIAIPEEMDKSIRQEFVNGTYVKPELKHILYNQGDVLELIQLKSKQDLLIDASNLGFFIRNIHFPLIRTLAIAEMEGMLLKEPEFIALAEEAEAKMRDIEKLLELEISTQYPKVDLLQFNKVLTTKIIGLNKRLAKFIDRNAKLTKLLDSLEQANKTHLKSYQITKSSIDKVLKDYTETTEKLLKIQETGNISWTSGQQVIKLLEDIGCNPMPKTQDKKTKKYKPSLAKAPREKWLLQNPTNPLYPIIKLYDDYMKQTKHVNSFGKSFITKYKHPVTGKYHTSYKQGTVETGRLASGNSDQSPARFNSQQLPRNKALRQCFTVEDGYNIVTCDLSGAELITMCSLAQDMNLLRIHKSGDLHSHFANLGWRAIYKHRGIEFTEADVISPTQHKQKRQDYKPMTFGTVYGLHDKKAAETLNVTVQEGQIAINTIINEIPDTIKFVKSVTKQALSTGYIIHNPRTNSRRWFPAVINQRSTGAEMSFLDKSTVEGASRNSAIQGTQSDMLCEAMVLLQRFIDFYHLDAVILMQVHDELVVKCHDSIVSWFPQRVMDCMTRAANKYLHGIEMTADMHILRTWTK